MTEIQEIRIAEIVGSGFCTASEDGQKVHDAIQRAISEGKQVILSFEGVQDLTSAFLNAAVGQLYSQLSEKEIRARILPPINATPENLILLKRVVERAKEFFKTPERFEKATKEVLGEDDDDDPPKK